MFWWLRLHGDIKAGSSMKIFQAHQLHGRFAVLLFFILLALLVSAAQVGAQAIDPASPAVYTTPTATSSADAELLPNFEPDAAQGATRSFSETLQFALDSYEQRSFDIDALLVGIEKSMLVPKRTYALFVPAVRNSPREHQQVQPTPTPRPEEPTRRADVWVTLWPEPSIRVGRDRELRYEIRLYNDGRAEAQQVVVELPYDSRLIKPIYSSLDGKAGDWVSAVTKDRVVVTFGRLDTNKSRSGYITFRVAADPADGTIISMRPVFRYTDAVGTRARDGNWAPVLVGGGNDTAAYVWMSVNPVQAAAGINRNFFSNRFAPNERVSAWLNTPNGVQALNRSTTADGQGQIWFDHRPQTLPRGTYQMVLYGNQSRLTGVVSFVVN